MNLLPDDVFMYLTAYLPPQSAASLASTCRRYNDIVHTIPRVWRKQLVLFDPFGPYSNLLSRPQYAFTAHAPHITHVTFGTPSSTLHYTRVTSTHFHALRHCVHLQQLHLFLPFHHVGVTGRELLTLMQALPQMQVLTVPYKLMEMEYDRTTPYMIPVVATQPLLRLTTLRLHGDAPLLQRSRPSFLHHLCKSTLTTLYLDHIHTVDIEHLLRTFLRLQHLHLQSCSTHREVFATALPLWQNRLMTLKTLTVYNSKRVLRSMRPLISFLVSWGAPLPLTYFGGDWDDSAFMHFLSHHCCVQCTRARDPAHTNLMRVTLCSRCVTTLPVYAQNLRTLEVSYCCSALPGCTNPSRDTSTPR